MQMQLYGHASLERAKSSRRNTVCCGVEVRSSCGEVGGCCGVSSSVGVVNLRHEQSTSDRHSSWRQFGSLHCRPCIGVNGTLLCPCDVLERHLGEPAVVGLLASENEDMKSVRSGDGWVGLTRKTLVLVGIYRATVCFFLGRFAAVNMRL